MNRSIIVAIMTAFWGFTITAASIASAENETYTAVLDRVKIAKVLDGDTVTIPIRMFGIDTPEKAQLCERKNGVCYPCGERSTLVLEGLLDGGATYRFTGETTYGRPVATIFLKQKDINLEMVRQGYAVVYETYLPAEMKALYLKVQQGAKEAERGIWQGKFIMPEDWRRGERLACE